MARKPLRSQLNQIRAWVREGRTDAWIAHQLELPAAELREFKQRHGLTADGGEADEDLRDEIEAEIEAATREADEAEVAAAEEIEAEEAVERTHGGVAAGADERSTEGDGEPRRDGDGEPAEATPRRRRRRGRRGRGGRGRGGQGEGRALQATFDHGEKDGYGLWLDPAVRDDPVYAEHWAGHRALKVTIEPDRIVLERIDGKDT
jgi:hypothetical protein